MTGNTYSCMVFSANDMFFINVPKWIWPMYKEVFKPEKPAPNISSVKDWLKENNLSNEVNIPV